MKREQRRYWLQSGDCWLCGMCRYLDRYSEEDYICEHPLPAVHDNAWKVEPHTDCWGFRPRKKERSGGTT